MSKFISLASVSAISILAFTTIPDLAQADEAPVGTIVVSALRTPVAADRVSSSVTVLDAKAIDEAQTLSLTDILVRTPGVAIARNGGYGTTTSLRIRGADDGTTVVVIDGMRLSDPSSTAGGANVTNLFLDDAERIEILRGPQSILWGSNAIGGVINVTTATPTRPLEGSFDLEGGSNQTVSARAGVGGTSDLVDWRLAGSTFTTDGVSARASGTEKDGYTRQSASGSARFKLAPDVSLDLRGYWSDARADFDGYSGDTSEYGTTKEWSGYAGLNFKLFDGALVNRLAAMQTTSDRENFDPSRDVRPIDFDAHGRVRRFEYQGTYTLNDAVQAVFGAEREEQRMTTASPDDSAVAYALTPYSVSTNSVYGQLRVTPFTGLTLDGGARYDHQSRFGANTVASAGAVYTPNGGQSVLRANYSEGYKAPSLYQMYSAYGDANLKPEKAKGWEVGIEQGLGSVLRASATWFERDTTNLIDFAYCATSGTVIDECYVPGTTTTRFGYYANVDKAHAKGVELAATAKWNVLFADANYTWTDAEDRTPDASTYGRQLARVPRHTANIEGGVDVSGLRASVAARYSGETFTSASSSVVLEDYWLFDVRGQYTLTPGLTLQARVENLTDKSYQTASGYSMLGRTIYVGVRSRF
ncbi:TonB-dependent receptor [Novosphingobium profundi]|uniref:TonB-dependent receptor n=1 Tax=Novosphingobium profundi TaxID=1774954 RepID=UPI0031BB9FE4